MFLNITALLITVSGISSGGYMASQVHIALSNSIQGAAIFAAGPYMCALGSISKAESECMSEYSNNFLPPNVYELIEMTNLYDYEKQIDPVTNLKNDKVFIFSGTLDTIISQQIVRKTEEYYNHFIPRQNIFTNYNIAAEHCLPTLLYGNPCSTLSSPYMSMCLFDGAGESLQILYDDLIVPLSDDIQMPHSLRIFDQTPFYNKNEYTSLNEFGFIYIPEDCEITKKCRMHISFHGCLQGWEFIANTYAVNSGFNVWAEKNNIIILYPYVKSSIDNPNGCWDWWGYTGLEYGTKYGKQIQFIERIIETFI